jgi:hypothetical protein
MKRKLSAITTILGLIFVSLLYFTDYLTPNVKYVRLKSGKEFKDVPVKWTSRRNVIIDSKEYYHYDIDSISK